MAFFNRFNLYDDLYNHEQKLLRACRQIEVLNKCLKDLVGRYVIVKDCDVISHSHMLKYRMSIVQGVLEMYIRFAQRKKRVVMRLRSALYGEANPEADDSDESDSESNESSDHDESDNDSDESRDHDEGDIDSDDLSDHDGSDGEADENENADL
ncbi:acidic leucine-rich nuclear phosphoprotein 32 family member B-like [Mya arenaria]|nr:acidic leucine-rich nuclear phosphoprotein 32 family member B-like [Mya arenaria]